MLRRNKIKSHQSLATDTSFLQCTQAMLLNINTLLPNSIEYFSCARTSRVDYTECGREVNTTMIFSLRRKQKSTKYFYIFFYCWNKALDIVITFVVLITTAHCSESNPCEGRPDGSFVVNPKGCKYFFLCQNGTAIEAFCPDGMWFNPEESICDRPSNVDCHFDDPPSTTTTTKSTTTTTTATTTRMTRTTRRTTRIFKTTVTTRTTKRPSKPNRPSKRPHRPPSNQPFTPTKQPLLSPTLPSSSNQPDEKVMCPPRDMRNIKFVASKLKCDRYFICYHTRAVAQQCIEGLHWNERDNRCDHPEMAKCSVKT